MERKLKLFVVFFSAFAIGATAYNFGQLSLFMWEQETKNTSAPESQIERLEIVEAADQDDFLPEIHDIPTFDEIAESNEALSSKSGQLIDVQAFGSPEGPWPSYSRTELKLRSGEEWLGLYTSKGKVRLAETKVTRSPRRGYIGQGDEAYDWLKYERKGELMFLVKGIAGLTPGEVTTLFQKKPSDDGVQMEQGFRSVFRLGAIEYVLRVTTGLQNDGGKVNVLILESQGKSQVVTINHYYKDNNTLDDIIGELLWVGDMDGDDRLDLYFSEYGYEKGGFGSNLYLSSPAKDGNLVERVAGFNSAGC